MLLIGFCNQWNQSDIPPSSNGPKLYDNSGGMSSLPSISGIEHGWVLKSSCTLATTGAKFFLLCDALSAEKSAVSCLDLVILGENGFGSMVLRLCGVQAFPPLSGISFLSSFP